MDKISELMNAANVERHIPVTAPDGKYEGELRNVWAGEDDDGNGRFTLFFKPKKYLDDTSVDCSRYTDQTVSWGASSNDMAVAELASLGKSLGVLKDGGPSLLQTLRDHTGVHFHYTWKRGGARKNGEGYYYNVTSITKA